MAIPLRVLTDAMNRPVQGQFLPSDDLEIDVVSRRADTGNVTIGSNLVAAQAVGSVEVLNLPSPGDTITIDGVVLTAVSGPRTPGSDDFSVDSGTLAGIAAEIEAAINDGANSFTGVVTASAVGSVVDLTAVPLGSAGNLITLATSDDTLFGLSGATLSGGSDVGELQLGSISSNTRVLGDLVVDGSSTISVDETVIGTFSVEGSVNLGNNTGDVIELGGGTSDTVNLNADLTVGSGVVSVGSGTSDYLSELWLSEVNGNGPDPGYNLTASGVSAGAYAIGINPSLLASVTSTDLMSALVELDSAISGVTLQQAYEAGNIIDVSVGEGPLQFRNDTSGDSTVALTVSRNPGALTAGEGLLVDLGVNASGDALRISNSGTGDALNVQDGLTSVFRVAATGQILLQPTTGQDATVSATGAGRVDIDTVSGDITLDSSGGSVSLSGGAASDFTTTSGDLILQAAAELTLNDVGGSSLELSQVGDRVLDQTGTGEIFENATSLVGALNVVARRVEVNGLVSAELPVENGVTLSTGYVVSASTVGGRITAGSAGAAGNKSIIGIALNGGTGDVGGTVSIRFALSGSLVQIPGGSFTPGTPIFAPLTPGLPSDTFGGGAGDRNVRLGYAVDTDLVVFQPASGFVL